MASSRKHQSAPAAQPRVYGYCRVSTDRQADSGLSLDEQERKITARCVENGWQLDHVYVDAGISGSVPLNKRPQGSRLLAAVRPGDVVIAAKMDRCFRSAFDALETIKNFKREKISLWLLDLGGDVSGNGISELIATVLAAVAQFERTLFSERIRDAKRNLRRAGRDQGGNRPFGFQFGAVTGAGKARDLVPDAAEQAAIADMVALRAAGKSLVAIRAAMHARGFRICKQSVWNILSRQEEAPPAALSASCGQAASSATLQIPADWIPDEALRDGGALTIIGAPRPVAMALTAADVRPSVEKTMYWLTIVLPLMSGSGTDTVGEHYLKPLMYGPYDTLEQCDARIDEHDDKTGNDGSAWVCMEALPHFNREQKKLFDAQPPTR